MIWKISPCLKAIIIGVFVNTWTADYKYPVWDSEDLLLFIQMKLSPKKKHFLTFLFGLCNVHQFFNIFKEKKIVIANVFPKLTTV